MSVGWSGADPTQAIDPGSYELGTEFLVGGSDITISAVRVWEGASPGTVVGRLGRIWTTGGSLLATASMPSSLPAGWSEYTLGTPLVVTANSRFVVSYTTGGNYGEIVGALVSNVPAVDGGVTALGSSNATNGNGVFTTSPTTFPTHVAGTPTFYGVDVVYTINGGNTPPVITAMTAVVNEATVTVVIQAADTETLVGASYGIEWGDGSTPVTGMSSPTAQHTYAASGIYSILGSVTDVGGLADHDSVPVQIIAHGPGASGPTLIEQVAALLGQLGIGVYAPNDVTGTIFLAALPDQPAQAIAVAQYGGPESDAGLGYDQPSIQVRVRGLDTDATDALRTAQRVYDALEGQSNVSLPGGIWLSNCLGTQGGPVYIGRDLSGRHEYTCNFRMEVRNTAGVRE